MLVFMDNSFAESREASSEVVIAVDGNEYRGWGSWNFGAGRVSCDYLSWIEIMSALEEGVIDVI